MAASSSSCSELINVSPDDSLTCSGVSRSLRGHVTHTVKTSLKYTNCADVVIVPETLLLPDSLCF